jgi:hypothetical protein
MKPLLLLAIELRGAGKDGTHPSTRTSLFTPCRNRFGPSRLSLNNRVNLYCQQDLILFLPDAWQLKALNGSQPDEGLLEFERGWATKHR